MSVLNHLVASTHDDYDIVWDTSVEFDEQKQLVFRLERSDYSGYSCFEGIGESSQLSWTKAILSFEDACRLARKLRVSTLDLPGFFSRKFGYCHDVESVEVQDTFKKMLNFVLSKGVHYRLHRTNEW